MLEQSDFSRLKPQICTQCLQLILFLVSTLNLCMLVRNQRCRQYEQRQIPMLGHEVLNP